MIKFDEYDYPMVKKFVNELKTDADLKKTKYLEAQFEISLTEDNLYMGYEVREAGYFGFTLMIIEAETIWKNRKRPIYIIVEEGPGYDVPEEFFYGYIGDALDKIKSHYDSFWLYFEKFPTLDRLNAHSFQETLKKELSSYSEIGAESDITFDEDDLTAIGVFMVESENYIGERCYCLLINLTACEYNQILFSVCDPHSGPVLLVYVSLDDTRAYKVEEKSYGERHVIHSKSCHDIQAALNEVRLLRDAFVTEGLESMKKDREAGTTKYSWSCWWRYRRIEA